MGLKWLNRGNIHIRGEELREIGKLIEKGICPECQDEKPSLIRDEKRKEYICDTCGLVISEDSSVIKYPDE